MRIGRAAVLHNAIKNKRSSQTNNHLNIKKPHEVEMNDFHSI